MARIMAAAGIFSRLDSVHRQPLRRRAHHREIRARFPGIRDISATPMPLRAIFVTVAKSTRGVAA